VSEDKVVTITITSKNLTDAEFAAARKNLAGLGAETKKQTEDSKGYAGSIKGFFSEHASVFKEVGIGLGMVGGALASVIGGVALLGARGADVSDVRDQFDILNKSIGNNAESLRTTLRSAVAGTISDYDLMKAANLELSQGLKLNEEQFGLTAKAARVLADRTGGDTKTAYESLLAVMGTGQTKQLKSIGLNIDEAAVLETVARSLGKETAALTESEKKVGQQNAVLAEMKRVLAESGEAEVDFGDRITQAKVFVSNFTDELGLGIAKSPVFAAGMDAIGEAIGSAVGSNQSGLIKTLVGWLETGAITLVEWGRTGLTVADVLGRGFFGLQAMFNGIMMVITAGVARFLEVNASVAEFVAKIPGVGDGFKDVATSARSAATFMGGVATGFTDAAKSAAEGAQGNSSYKQGLDKIDGVLVSVRNRMVDAQAATEAHTTTTTHAIGVQNDHGASLTRVSEAVKEVEKNLRKLSDELQPPVGHFISLTAQAKVFGDQASQLVTKADLMGVKVPASVRAIADAWNASEITKLMATTGAKWLKDLDEFNAKSLEKLEARTKRIADDMIANDNDETTARREHEDNILKMTGTTFDQQRAQVTRWLSDERHQLELRGGDWSRAYAGMELVAQDKLRMMEVDTDALVQNSRASLQEIADKAWQTYGEMADAPARYSKAAIQHFKEVAQAAQDAADGIEHPFTVALGGLSAMFVKLGQVAGGSLGSIFSAIGQTVVQLEAAQQAADKSHGKFGQLSTIFDSNASSAARMGAGVAAIGSVAQGVSDVMKATSEHSTAAGNAMGGAMAGMQAGAFAGPWGMAVGAAAGFMVGLIKGKPEWSKVTDEVGRDFGAKISKSLAEEIAKQAKELFHGDRSTADIFNVNQILGPTTLANLATYEEKIHNVFSFIERHQLTLAQGAAVIDGAWAGMVAVGTDAFGRIDDKLKELIHLNDVFGTQSKSIADFLRQQGANALDAFAVIVGGLDDSSQGYGTLKGQITAAQKAVDALKAKGDDQWASWTEGQGAATVGSAAWLAALKALNDLTGQQQTLAAGAKQGLDDLGIQAVATYAAAVAGGMSSADALAKISPALKTLQQDYADLGLNVDDAALKNLMLQATITTGNPKLLTAIAGLSAEMVALDNMGAMNIVTFGAMERTGTTMYQRLQASVAAAGGTTEDALRPMQGFLHQAMIEAKNLGIPLDDNTQMLIDQSKQLGIWKADGKSANDKMLEGFDRIGDGIDRLIDLFSDKLPASLSAMSAAGNSSMLGAGGVKSALADVGETAGGVLGAIRDGIDQIPRTIHIDVDGTYHPPDIPDDGGGGGDFPGHARGGLFRHAHPAWIAERGKPEIVGDVEFMTRALAGALARMEGRPAAAGANGTDAMVGAIQAGFDAHAVELRGLRRDLGQLGGTVARAVRDGQLAAR
jgi:hypothetical protein